MRRLLLALIALGLGVVVGCRCSHTHMAGVCDCVDRGMYHDTPRYDLGYNGAHSGQVTTELPREMPKAR